MKIWGIFIEKPQVESIYFKCNREYIIFTRKIYSNFDTTKINISFFKLNFYKIEFPSEKDFTDFEEALMWISKSYPQKKVHVLGAFGGRVDHAISCLWTMFRPELQALIPFLSLEDEWNHISFLTPGDYVIEKLEHTKYLSFISTGPVQQLTLKNVKYPLNHQDYDFPIALISNEFIEDKMEISFKSGGVIVGQTRDSWR